MRKARTRFVRPEIPALPVATGELDKPDDPDQQGPPISRGYLAGSCPGSQTCCLSNFCCAEIVFPQPAKSGRSAQLVRSSTAVTQLGFEPDSFDLGLWLCHEFTNCLEDNPKLRIVLLLQLI